MKWSTHLVIVHPLWLGTMPALLKALLEQLIRPGFAFSTPTLGHWPVKFLTGKSARIIVTTGMSTLSYRWRFGAYSSRTLGRIILATSGVKHIRTIVIGNAETMSRTRRNAWRAKVKALGRRAR